MPNAFPVQEISRGGRSCRIVDVIVPGPAFQRNSDPSARRPRIDVDFTSGFQLDQCSIAVSTSQTTSGAAAISVSHIPTTGACRLTTSVAGSESSWMTRVFIAAPPSQVAGVRIRRETGDLEAGFLAGSRRRSVTQEEQHREHPPRFGSGRGQLKLREDARDVLFDGSESE